MLKLAASVIDITPPDGQVIGMVMPEKTEKLLDPLFGRLYLLDDGEKRFLAVSLDYCGTTGEVNNKWRHALAKAAGTSFDMTVMHSIHQHDSPFINVPVSERLYPTADFSWLDPMLKKLTDAAAELEKKLVPVAKIGWSETRIHGYASNRRVPMPDGTIATRYSRCVVPEIRERPVGDIDPMLRTLGFYGADGTLLASWNFYATHPQVGNEGRRYGCDAPGEAMKLMKAAIPGAVHSPFNGCLGNVTAGKYSDVYDVAANIRNIGKKMADGILLNLKAQDMADAPEKMEWYQEAFPFPERILTDEMLATRSPLQRECLIEAHKWAAANSPEMYPLSMLKLGDIRLFWLQGELFIEYQIWMQSQIPDERICVAGNCGDDFYYVGTAEALNNPGGYEVQGFCRTLPEFEELFKNTFNSIVEKSRG